MLSANGKDIRNTTAVAAAGAGPAFVAGDTGVQKTLGPVMLSDFPARPNSVCFDVPVEISIPAGQSVSYTGFCERSSDGVTWTQVEGPVHTGSWSNPASAAAALSVKSAVRVGCDVINAGCDRVRAKVTLTFPSTAIPTPRGLSVLGGGLDVRGAVPLASKSVT